MRGCSGAFLEEVQSRFPGSVSARIDLRSPQPSTIRRSFIDGHLLIKEEHQSDAEHPVPLNLIIDANLSTQTSLRSWTVNKARITSSNSLSELRSEHENLPTDTLGLPWPPQGRRVGRPCPMRSERTSNIVDGGHDIAVFRSLKDDMEDTVGANLAQNTWDSPRGPQSGRCTTVFSSTNWPDVTSPGLQRGRGVEVSLTCTVQRTCSSGAVRKNQSFPKDPEPPAVHGDNKIRNRRCG